MSDQLRGNALVNDALGSALRNGGNALGTVPALLKRVLADGSWREFVTKRDEHVQHGRFADFVTMPPLKGLGADMALIDRIVGTDDPDLLRMLREAQVGKRGRPHTLDKTDVNNGESPVISSVLGDDSTSRDVDRLARQAPEEYAAVRRGEKSVNAAAISAGIRKRRIPVRLDSPESAAETLRKHMPPEGRRRLAELLTEED
jgi:hypothetical protein